MVSGPAPLRGPEGGGSQVKERSKGVALISRGRTALGRRRVIRVGGSCLAAAALAAGTIVGVVAGAAGGSTGKKCSSSATKCFALSIAPKTAAPGTSATFTFTVTNEAPTQNLGSLQVTRPAGFTITGATVSRGSVTFTATHALFKTLTLAPGGGPSSGVSFTVTATAPCAAESYKWGIQVKQSNNFSGTGNTFALEKSTATAVNGSVTSGTGGCSVAFVPTNEPKTTVVTSPILNGFASTGTPVEAAVYTPAGQIATTFSGSIVVTLSRNPTGAKLSGGTTVTVAASGGIAQFSSLTVNLVGSGYRLTAASPGLTATPPAGLSPISSLFSIYTKLAPCTPTSCTVTGSTTKKGKTRITLTETTTSAPVGGGYIGVGFGGAPTLPYTTDCAGTFLVTAADIASADVFFRTGKTTNQNGSTTTWTIVYEITKSILKSSGQTGASQWQICYVSTTTFTTASGAQASAFPTPPSPGITTYYIGLLPTSSPGPGMPYIRTRHKDGAGDEIITIKASGDGFIRP